MPVIKIDTTKGLYEELGGGVQLTPINRAVSAGDEIDTSGFHLMLTSTEALTVAATKNVTLKNGQEIGQLLMLTNNNSNAAHDIEFADGHLAISLAAAAAVTLVPGTSTLMVWNGTAWSPTSQSLK